MSYSKHGIRLFDHHDISKLDSMIDNTIINYCKKSNIDLYDYEFKKKITAAEVAYIIRMLRDDLFLPAYTDHFDVTETRNLLDLSDIVLFNFITDKYLRICSFFGVALGLYSYSVLLNISYGDIPEWVNEPTIGKELNAARAFNVKKVSNFRAREIVNNLQASPVGTMAVANNDTETGLQWAKNQQITTEKTTVYYLPSERVDRLRLETKDDNS